MVIPKDSLFGWSFTSPDDSAIGISGSACPSLKSGVYSQVAISYVCGGPSHPTTERSRPPASS